MLQNVTLFLSQQKRSSGKLNLSFLCNSLFLILYHVPVLKHFDYFHYAFTYYSIYIFHYFVSSSRPIFISAIFLWKLIIRIKAVYEGKKYIILLYNIIKCQRKISRNITLFLLSCIRPMFIFCHQQQQNSFSLHSILSKWFNLE